MDSLINGDWLIEDLEFLREKIFESHPLPGGYAGDSLLESAFEKAIQEAAPGMKYADFIRVVQRTIMTQLDSHTTVDFGNVREKGLLDNKRLTPLQFGFDGQDLWIKSDALDSLPKGTKLLKWNGIDASELIKIPREYAFTEGDAGISRMRVETALLPIIMMMNGITTHTNKLQVILPGDTQIVNKVYPGFLKEAIAKMRSVKKKSPLKEFKDQFSYTYYEDIDLGVLKVGTFVPLNSIQGPNRFYRKTFREIRRNGVKNLAIDLRDNTGGSSANVEFLASFLFEDGHNAPDNIIYRQSELAKQRNRRNSWFIWKAFYKMSQDENVKAFLRADALDEGDIDTVYFKEPVMQKSDYVYDGNCYVFINGLTASAAVDFSGSMRKRGRAMIVGEDCMGSGHGTWGNPVSLYLPKTGLMLSLATIRYNSDRSFDMTREALKPDILVREYADDDAANRDAWIEKMKEVLAGKPH
jgi:hypothetical protein